MKNDTIKVIMFILYIVRKLSQTNFVDKAKYANYAKFEPILSLFFI